KIFVFDVVGEGNCRLAGVGFGFGADFQFPVHHDPLGGEFKIFIIREAQSAVDRQTVQRRRTGIEDNIDALIDGDDGAFGWLLLVCPGLAFALCALPASASYGQTVGAVLQGTVSDITGAVLPGAMVAIKNSATGGSIELLTDERGRYLAALLQPGEYEI